MDLVMVIHCHQPVGNFDHVFERAHDRCYGPLLDLLYAHPGVRVGLHFSGPLLEWLEKNRPRTLDRMADMVARAQVEPLSGGFFEPLLAAIPARDAEGQVRMMNRFLEKRFGRRPTGFWLTERVWDPGLPRVLSGTGLDYTVVDDTHFYYAGLRPGEIYGPYITEKEGKTLRLLATPMILRYLIPFRPVETVMDHLRAMEERGQRVAVYGDDGEKFGMWPGTYEWVVEKGWLERFFTAITENGEWLHTVPPGEYVAENPPLGRIYLPQASYEEMTQWALPPEQGRFLEEIVRTLKEEGRWDRWRPFVRGGVWDNFLVRYDEANRMHKKMIFLSERAGEDETAREFLWRGQCNCAYWHGVFGGLYLGHLRRAVHENLLRAQARLTGPGERVPRLTRTDVDRDGFEEILIRTSRLGLGLQPARGGGLFEVSYLPRFLNLADTLTRRPEAYHARIREGGADQGAQGDGIPSIHDVEGAGDGGLKEALVYDTYPRTSLLDHFFPPDAAPGGYAANDFAEMGDFVQGAYHVEQARVAGEAARVVMTRDGRAGPGRVRLRKEIRAEGSVVSLAWAFQCPGPAPVSLRYGCEFNLTLFSDRDPERYFHVPETGARREVRETGAEEGIRAFELVNGPDGLVVSFSFSRAVSAWFFPLMTVSKSETGFERTYQGSSLLFTCPLDLSPGETQTLQMEMEVRETVPKSRA